MRTNAQLTRKAFGEWFNSYMEWRTFQQQIEYLAMLLENNESYYRNFMESRRMKPHSGAFYAVILAIKPYLPVGYYASNPQIKANILHFFNMDYKEFLKPLSDYLEKEREENLK